MYWIPWFRKRPEWMSYAFWRGYRTWWQTFPGALLAWIAVYAESGWQWDMRVFVTIVLIPSFSATLGWFSNLAAQEDMLMDEVI